MRLAALALTAACLPPLAASAQGQSRALTQRQYTLVMEDPEVQQSGYERLTTRHRALAACIRWADVRPDRVPVFAVRTFGGNDVREARQEAMELCAALEAERKCKCRLVDVDGRPAR